MFNGNNNVLTAEPSFLTFYQPCLFCSNIVVKIMEFDSTVIQVRGLPSNKTRIIQPFSTIENACTKSRI